MSLEEDVAIVCPSVTVLGREDTNRKILRVSSVINDTLKLKLELGSAELLTLVYGLHNVKLAIAHDGDVVVGGGIIGDFNVRWLDGDAARIEHVPVRVHGERFVSCVFGLERCFGDLLAERQR